MTLIALTDNYLLYSGMAYLLAMALTMVYLFPANSSIENRKSKYKKCIHIIVAIGILKVAIDINKLFIINNNTNLYSRLGLQRTSSHINIVQAFNSIPAAARSDDIKFAYDCLVVETSRSIYNNFGYDIALAGINPLKDELALLTAFVKLIFIWASLLFVFTMSHGSTGARMWTAILFTSLLYIHFSFTVLGKEIPPIFDSLVPTMTEYELTLVLYSIYPIIAALLACISQANYVNVEQVVTEILASWSNEQKLQMAYLHSLQVSLTSFNVSDNRVSQLQPDNLNILQQQIGSAIESLKEGISNEKRLSLIKALDSSEDSIGGKYLRWLSIAFFIFMHFL